MDIDNAKRLAKKYSNMYLTFWYVREVQPGKFEPYAHSSDDEKTVACFYCGKKWGD